LLQLVQALKHEIHHDSALSRFLIVRSICNLMTLGHQFYWYLKGCLAAQEYRERYEVILTEFLRYCDSFRAKLYEETLVYRDLTTIANEIKTINDNEEKLTHLRSSLGKLKFPDSFHVPINPNYKVSNVVVSKCKYMVSKTFPLWLVFENCDKFGSNISVIFKVGDDLRQDQLTLQMFRIMDKLWFEAGLDLKMSPYLCIETGNKTGMIEVVPDSETTASIQKQFGGVAGAFSEKPLSKWLETNNPPEDMKEIKKHFIRSCSGYCVATYVIGIGDRHNDNIMCTKNGHLFHIDFGRFLGNTEKFGIINRDRAPFVFTPEFAYMMGGTTDPHFKWFISLCVKAYNILRFHASIFINLFSMMVKTGIPELQTENDIEYLREAFSLDLDDVKASEKYVQLIGESLKSKATQWNFEIHILANPKKL